MMFCDAHVISIVVQFTGKYRIDGNFEVFGRNIRQGGLHIKRMQEVARIMANPLVDEI